MTSRDFVYWLQGYFELKDAHLTQPVKDEAIPPETVTVIKKHLAMVFKHEIDPGMGDEKHRSVLAALHSSGFETKINC